jgi:uncharacterized protein (TIGR03086 family)
MTPCVGWDLQQLLRHMVGQDYGFAAAADADVDVDAFGPRDLGDDIASALSSSVTSAHQAFAHADPERSVLMPEFGMQRFPLTAVIGFHFIDTVVHGWDVAATIGVPLRYHPDLVAAALAQARAVPDGPFRGEPGAPFGRPLTAAPESGPWQETLRWLGRDPEWTATAGLSGNLPAL